MPIIVQQHKDHGPPRCSRNAYALVMFCDCYDGTEDASPFQPIGSSWHGECWVEAALEWNQDIEDLSD